MIYKYKVVAVHNFHFKKKPTDKQIRDFKNGKHKTYKVLSIKRVK